MRKWFEPATFFLLISLWVAGCATMPESSSLESKPMKADIFTEVTGVDSPCPGLADLVIKASIKTPPKGHNVFWWINDLHGRADYPFRFSVDGQAITWKADNITHDSFQGDESPPDNPERGIGVKYMLEKRIRLAPGAHTVSFSLPAEEYVMQVEISMREGMENIIEFKPIYRKRFKGNIRNFLFGLKQYEVALNGKQIK